MWWTTLSVEVQYSLYRQRLRCTALSVEQVALAQVVPVAMVDSVV